MITAMERRRLREEARAWFDARRNDDGTRMIARLLDAAESEALEQLVNATETRTLYQAQGCVLLVAALREVIAGRGRNVKRSGDVDER